MGTASPGRAGERPSHTPFHNRNKPEQQELCLPSCHTSLEDQRPRQQSCSMQTPLFPKDHTSQSPIPEINRPHKPTAGEHQGCRMNPTLWSTANGCKVLVATTASTDLGLGGSFPKAEFLLRVKAKLNPKESQTKGSRHRTTNPQPWVRRCPVEELLPLQFPSSGAQNIRK